MTKSRNIGVYKRPIPLFSDLQKSMFWDKVSITANEDKCWNWIGSLTGKNYGEMRVSGKIFTSHRISYFLSTGVNPNNLCVLHSCDNTKCVNPKHLSLGTHSDNMKDMKQKGRNVSFKGSENPFSKLNEETVLEIKKDCIRLNISKAKIAKTYNVSGATVCNIAKGKSWGHVKI